MSDDGEVSSFDGLCDNTLAYVISFLDFKSSIWFTRGTAQSLRKRIVPSTVVENDEVSDAASFEQVWSDMYVRHQFSPVETSDNKRIDYVTQCRKRRKLFSNLMGCSKKSRNRNRSCFNLPNRYFYFVPISPKDNDDMEDSPPVDFDCSSFVLTSTGVGSELLFLNPFDGSLSVLDSCVANAVKSDEAMMEQAMLDAASMIIHRRDNVGSDEAGRDEHVIAGAVIDDTVYRNHNISKYRTPPSQTLLDRWMQDFLDVDLLEYINSDTFHGGRTRNMHQDETSGTEIVVDYIGIDSKPILRDENTVIGTLIGVGRTLSNEAETFEDERVCTELLAWRRCLDEKNKSSQYQERLVCRVEWSYVYMDMCAKYNRLYVVFHPGDGPHQRGIREVDESDEAPFPSAGRPTVVVYPLLPYPIDDTNTSAVRYFPKPETFLHCQHSVSVVVVDPSGNTVLVGTSHGTIELWEMNEHPLARRRYTLNLKASTVQSVKRFSAQKRGAMDRMKQAMENPATQNRETRNDENDCQELSTEMEVDSETENVPGRLLHSSQTEVVSTVSDDYTLPRLNPSQKVQSLHFPLHCPVDQCGFVSMQHDREEGTTLLLWKNDSLSSASSFDEKFQVVSLINLPLSAQREPKVFYDGRRLIVLGQDHIGMIILVYHVLSSWEDVDSFDDHRSKKVLINSGDDSAGLYNFTDPARVAFSNRIRHAGLGGLAYYDSLYMTCNERFIVVNTKTGTLVGGDSGHGEGLLVIDLEDHS